MCVHACVCVCVSVCVWSDILIVDDFGAGKLAANHFERLKEEREVTATLGVWLQTLTLPANDASAR